MSTEIALAETKMQAVHAAFKRAPGYRADLEWTYNNARQEWLALMKQQTR